MPKRMVRYAAVACAVVAVGWFTARPMFGTTPRKSPSQVINELAFAERADRPETVKRLVDEIVWRKSLIPIPESHPSRARIVRAELNFRLGTQPAIREADLAATINAFVKEAEAPAWAATNEAQIHLFREIVRPSVPMLIGTAAMRGNHLNRDLTTEMSPAEAIYVMLGIGSNKLLSPEFQISADDWVANVRTDMTAMNEGPQGEMPPAAKRSSVRKVPASVTQFERFVTENLKDNHSVVTARMNRLLDLLGLAK